MRLELLLVAAVVAAATTLLSALLIPLARFVAFRLGAVDLPGQRKIHVQPMPRTGGLAVFLAFVSVVIVGYLLLPALRDTELLRPFFGATFELIRDAGRVAPKLYAFLAGGALILGVGLADDVLGTRFPAGVKALGQLIAATLLVIEGVQIDFLPAAWMNIAATIVWLVGITNAFNLLDNMDGLSAGVALVASGILLLNAWRLNEVLIAALLVAFIGSLLGFLLFNFHPAKIFLGDCGSLFIGYVMAALTLLERYVSHASNNLFAVLMPVLLLAVPIIDTTTVVVIRVRERRPIYVGDRRHLSHRLLALGFSQRAAALVLYLATFCLGLGALILPQATPAETLFILVQGLGFVALLLVLMFVERRPQPGTAQEGAAD
jgi:UDP-GlcNAc:undecaprenyl-phosphate GlcNAc-1-phosphate transferase